MRENKVNEFNEFVKNKGLTVDNLQVGFYALVLNQKEENYIEIVSASTLKDKDNLAKGAFMLMTE